MQIRFLPLAQSYRSWARCASIGLTGTLLACLLATASPAQPEGAFLSRFDGNEPLGDGWRVSNFAIQDEAFRTAWRRQSVTRSSSAGSPLQLSLFPAPDSAEKMFFGAEIQRARRTHYGRYEVEMTAGRGDGVISSFFTYTGAYFGDPQDEIDFEFLGRDTTKVWVTRFAKGERLPGEWVPLGFDAAEGPHLYTFEWHPERIVWYADGEEIFRVEGSDRTLPDIPSRIYINIWAGGDRESGWAGTAPPETRAAAEYYCISYTPMGSDAPNCSDE